MKNVAINEVQHNAIRCIHENLAEVTDLARGGSKRPRLPTDHVRVSMPLRMWIELDELLQSLLPEKPKRLDPTKRYRVGTIDRQGLLGRERHPLPHHELQPARLLEVLETVPDDADACSLTFQIWLCLVGEGREAELVELADYELNEVAS